LLVHPERGQAVILPFPVYLPMNLYFQFDGIYLRLRAGIGEYRTVKHKEYEQHSFHGFRSLW
jgi:hypothetical protein